jgi:response regulator RpfG family c-di-GMP phosphodiesterase
MKRVIIYSPDFSLCYSLLLYLQNRFKLVVTTDFNVLNEFSFNTLIDVIFIDHEPNNDLLKICQKIKSSNPNIPIFLTYVYNKRVSYSEEKIKSYVDEIFYKPFDLNEISSKLTEVLGLPFYQF